MEKKAFEIVENDQSQAEIVINGNSIGVISSYDAVLIGSKLRVWMNANKREASIGYMVNNPFCSRVNVAKSFPSDMITTQIMICRCKYNSDDTYTVVAFTLPLVELTDSTFSSSIVSREDLDKYVLLLMKGEEDE